MTLPTLKPRPGQSRDLFTSPPQMVPTQHDWAAMYPEIERLYVREHRKLRYVMQHMAQEHNFKATIQMYKKRFSKWGFQKNTKRSATGALTRAVKNDCRKAVSRQRSGSRVLRLPLKSPHLSPHEALMFKFMKSVHVYSIAFFESMQAPKGYSLTLQQQSRLSCSRPEDTDEVTFAFKLAIELLDRGHGNLAGRMARKAFLLVEDTILALEGPVMMWNLFELFHHMVKLGHMQLFQMLLTHLIRLADGQTARRYPLVTMLHGLLSLVVSLSSFVSNSSSLAAFKASSVQLQSSLAEGKRDASTADVQLFSEIVVSLLERAWILNAAILLENFDHRLFPIYFHIHWDMCSIRPPTAVFGVLKQWVSHVEQQQASITAMGALDDKIFLNSTLAQQLLPPNENTSPPQDYEVFHTSSIAALWKYSCSILSENSETADTFVLLRLLAGLFTAETLERWSTAVSQLDSANITKLQMSRVHADNIACAIKTLTTLDSEHVGDVLWQSLDTAEQNRSIVALREYAHGNRWPRIVSDMWRLQDALIAAGEYEEARAVEQSASKRLEEYMKDIPTYAA